MFHKLPTELINIIYLFLFEKNRYKMAKRANTMYTIPLYESILPLYQTLYTKENSEIKRPPKVKISTLDKNILTTEGLCYLFENDFICSLAEFKKYSILDLDGITSFYATENYLTFNLLKYMKNVKKITYDDCFNITGKHINDDMVKYLLSSGIKLGAYQKYYHNEKIGEIYGKHSELFDDYCV